MVQSLNTYLVNLSLNNTMHFLQVVQSVNTQLIEKKCNIYTFYKWVTVYIPKQHYNKLYHA